VQGDDLGSYFQDLQSRFSRASDALTAARDSVNGAFDIYVSHVSHRTNNVMKVLTVVATILLPATVITGFFGTNFPSVPMNTRPFFVVMVTSILLISAGLLVTFRRQGWL
jgi:magnesium transporter